MSFDAALIHLSDIECGPNNRADPKNAGEFKSEDDCYCDHVRQLAADIRELFKSKDTEMNRAGLVISGDLTSSGRPEEFEKAATVLQNLKRELGIASGHVAIVPGNHDVSWESCREAHKEEFGVDTIEPKNIRKVRQSPHKLAHFAAFIKAQLGIEFVMRDPIAFPDFRDLNLAVVGLDSTFPSTFREEDNYGLIEEQQILKAGELLAKIRGMSPTVVPVAVMHHCLLPLKRGDMDRSFLREHEMVAGALEKAGFGVTLCGHAHRKASYQDLESQHIVMTAGTYGLCPAKLLERYESEGVTANVNRYQIVFIRSSREAVVVCRMRHSGRSDPWGPDHPPSYPFRWYDPRVDKVDASVERPLVRLHISEAEELPFQKYVQCVALIGRPDQLKKIKRVIYALRPMISGEDERSITATASDGFVTAFQLSLHCQYSLEAAIESDDVMWKETRTLQV
jgi:3',5'-cyclic AMP phosphodiesterase CpdA